MICNKLSSFIVSIYRGWYKYCLKEGIIQSKLVLIDDLAPKEIKANNYSNLTQIKNDLESVLPEVTNDSYTTTKIKNSISYIETQINKEKPISNLKDYITSLGTRWRTPLLNEIDFISKKIDSYNSKDIKPAEVMPSIKNNVSKIQSYLKNKQLDIIDFTLKFEEYDSALPWRNIVTYEKDSFILLVNKKHKYNEFDIVSFVFHEVFGHVVHFNKLLKNKNIAPHLLCISVHTLDSFYAESIAQLLFSFFVDNFFSSNKLYMQAKYRFQLFFAVRHYNIVKLIENDTDLSNATDLHYKFLGGDRTQIESLYVNIQSNPFFCSQVMNYHEGLNILSPILNLEKEIGLKIIKQLLRCPLTYEQLEAYANI